MADDSTSYRDDPEWIDAERDLTDDQRANETANMALLRRLRALSTMHQIEAVK